MHSRFVACVFALLALHGARVGATVRILERVELRGDASAPLVAITTDRPANFTSFKLARPARIVVDFPETRAAAGLQGDSPQGNVTRWGVETLGDESAPIARVTVELTADADYTLRSDGALVELRLVAARARPLLAIEHEVSRPAPPPSPALTDIQRRVAERNAAAEAKARLELEAKVAALEAREAKARAAADAKARASSAAASAAVAAKEARARAASDRRATQQAAAAELARRATEEKARKLADTKAKAAERARLVAEAKARADEDRARRAVAAKAKAAELARRDAEARAKAAEARAAKVAEAARRDAEAKAKAAEARAAKVAASRARQQPAARLAALTHLAFRRTDEGARLTLRTSTATEFQSRAEGSRRLVVVLEKTHVPSVNNRRPLDTRYFETAVAGVVPIEDPGAQQTRVEIELTRTVDWETHREGANIVVDFREEASASIPWSDADEQAGDP